MSISTTTDEAPPHDLEAEQSVLGSILLNQDKLDDVALVLRPADFYVPANRIIFDAMLDMHSKGRGVDGQLLVSTMRRAGQLDEVGGVTYIGEVADSVPAASNAVWYAEQVKDCSLLRSLLYAGMEMIHEAHRGEGSPRERVARAEGKVLELLEHGVGRDVKPIRDVLFEAISEIDDRATRGSVAGLTTGYTQLDLMMGGMRPGELIILAARPSHGKSALVANIVEHVCVNDGKCALFVSLEMSAKELGERMLSSMARVNGASMRDGRLTPIDRSSIVAVVSQISQSPMFVDDSPQRNIVEISSAARRLRRTSGLALLVVDYLQLIEPDNRRDSREQQVAIISRRLKQLARELKIPVVCLAQLNRENEKQGDRVPKLSYLRESGAIEQDADVVLFIHREDMYRQPSEWDNKALVIVAKNRNGQRGRVNLEWTPHLTRFDNPRSEWTADKFDYPVSSDERKDF